MERAVPRGEASERISANFKQFLDSRPNTPSTPRGRSGAGGFVEKSADDKSAAFLPLRELEQLRVSGGNDENAGTTNGSS